MTTLIQGKGEKEKFQWAVAGHQRHLVASSYNYNSISGSLSNVKLEKLTFFFSFQ